MKRTIEIDLSYQNRIDSIPPQYGDIYKQACSGDRVTVDTWRPTWQKNYKANVERFGDFGEKSYGKLFGINRHKPAIVIGSGPSLKNSIQALNENKQEAYPVLTVSCLHNFGLFEDEGCHADYYLSLDSGGVVIDDATEARNKDGNFYWDRTKDKKLLAYVASDPRLFDLWQGEVYLFNCLLPDIKLRDDLNALQRFSHFISAGGNALGACMYAAKAVMGSSEIIYVGADFCFDYNLQFHSYKTRYDNIDGKGIGNVIRWPDVYGISRATWPSYLNFKLWADWVSMNVPGGWATASEGLLGSYLEGNISSFRYGTLQTLLERYRIADTIRLADFKVENGEKTVVKNEDGSLKMANVKLKDFFSDSKQPLDLTLF